MNDCKKKRFKKFHLAIDSTYDNPEITSSCPTATTCNSSLLTLSLPKCDVRSCLYNILTFSCWQWISIAWGKLPRHCECQVIVKELTWCCLLTDSCIYLNPSIKMYENRGYREWQMFFVQFSIYSIISAAVGYRTRINSFYKERCLGNVLPSMAAVYEKWALSSSNDFNLWDGHWLQWQHWKLGLFNVLAIAIAKAVYSDTALDRIDCCMTHKNVETFCLDWKKTKVYIPG